MVKIGFSKKSAQASANQNKQKKLSTEAQVAISERKHQFVEQEVSSPPLCGACHCGVTFSRSDEDSTTPPTHNLSLNKSDGWSNYNWWFGSSRNNNSNNNKRMNARNGCEHDYEEEEEDREPPLTYQREDNCAVTQRNLIRRKQMKKSTSASKENYRKSKLIHVKGEDDGRIGVGGQEETELFNPLSSRIRIVGGPTLPRHHNLKDINTDEIESVCLGKDGGIYNHSTVPQNNYLVHSLKKKRR